ncbi:RNA-dependent RNA polymerase [Wenling chuvirus-like virus 1]|uniref:RNA-dependent RNA polymerase n=1 Tax=Wenling chuvirus-like virus 1 TaxID=1922377 RepID=UPI00090BFFE7|nr:RNA-dependent RNA polymerase [Wenling chuvirus-like virus 1]APG78818.1 RNA-dependent RNA polymerase [Wenling chuvirus-like virus 1]
MEKETIIKMEHSQKKTPFSPHHLVFERKFDIALRKSHANEVKKRMLTPNLNRDDHLLLKSMTAAGMPLEAADWAVNRNIWPHLYKEAVEYIRRTPTRPLLAAQLAQAARKCLEIQLEWNNHKNDTAFKGPIPDFATDMEAMYRNHPTMRMMTSVLPRLDDLVNRIPVSNKPKPYNLDWDTHQQALAPQCWMELKPLGCRVAWSGRSCAILYKGVAHILPRDYLLMIHNKLADIISISLLAISTPDEVYDGENLLDRTTEMFWELAKLAVQYKGKYFRIMKVLESLVIAETLVKEEGRKNDVFLRTVTEDLETDTGYDYQNSRLKDILLEVCTPLQHEFACLSKVMGHPFCDLELGAADLHQKTTEPRLVVPARVLQCVRYAKENFIRNYILRYERWPLVEISPQAPLSLVQAALTNLDPKSRKHVKDFGPVRLHDYDHIELLPVEEFDYLDNFIPYVKDRTISLCRSQVIATYLQGQKRPFNDWKHTRLLLFYLLNDSGRTDHKWYLNEFMANDVEALKNYLVIRIVPKEKELKEAARGFGCKTYEDRARTLVQEYNSAKFLNKYSDEEAMTLSELTLLRKLYAFRHMDRAYPGFKEIIINVDASAWNNRFRHAATESVLRSTLDKVYDKRLFSKTHEAYQNSFIYMPDQDKVYYWDGQEGGIEGLNQDTWVYVYTHQIKVCLERYPYPYHILCKGDDLRAAIMIPPEVLDRMDINDIKNQLLAEISTVGGEFGHKIKAEDSYASECYFAFSKNAFVANIEMPQSFRKIQKCYGANNAFLTCLDDYVGSSYSNAHSASRTSPSPISCYVVALLWSLYYIKQNRVLSGLTQNQLVALLLTPNIVGGLPIVYLHNFYTRAESDLLPPYIDLVKFCTQYYPEVVEYLVSPLDQELREAEDNLVGLMIDPYSIPFAKPSQPQSILRQGITKMLKRKAKNEDIKELLELSEEGFTEAMCELFKTANVYNAKLMSALFGCSPSGLVMELVRKWESGKSVYEALIFHLSRKEGNQILRKAFIATIRLDKYRLRLFTRSKDMSDSAIIPRNWRNLCSTEIAQYMRDKAWGKRVEAVTQPCLQHLLKIGPISLFGTNYHASTHHFEIRCTTKETQRYTHGSYQDGPYDPFIGGATGVGLAPPEVSFLANNILTSKLHTLLELYRWSHMTGHDAQGRLFASNFPDLVRHLIESYSNVDLNQLAPFAGSRVAARTTQHHIRSNQYKVSTVPNTLQNIYTQVQGNSHTHSRLEASIAHHKINYHHVFCHAVSTVATPVWLGKKRIQQGRVWVVTEECDYCMAPIEETPMVLGRTNLPRVRLSLDTKVGRDALIQVVKQLESFDPVRFHVDPTAAMDMTAVEAERSLIQHYIDRHWRSRSKLQVRYTNHHMTHAGYDVLSKWGQHARATGFSLEDLARLNMRMIIEELAPIVWVYILKLTRDCDGDNVVTLLGSIPAQELPWTIILNEIKQVGRLFELQQKCIDLMPHLKSTTFDSPDTFAPFFGGVCFWLAERGMGSNNISILSNLADDECLPLVAHRIKAAQKQILLHHYIKLWRQIKQSQDLALIREAEMLLAIAACTSSAQEIIDNDIAPNLTQRARHEVCLIDVDGDLGEFMEEWIADPLDEPALLKWVKEVCPSIKWANVQQRIVDEPAEVHRLVRQVLRDRPSYLYNIFKTDIVSCLNRVKETAREGLLPRPIATHSSLDMPALEPQKHHNIDIRHFHSGVFRHTTPLDLEYKEPEDWEKTFLNRRWVFRPFGVSNISMSKTAYLMHHIGLHRLPANGCYVCLGDGYGGCTAVINAMTLDSSIIYNTLPNTLHSNPSALSAELEQSVRNNKIDKSNITLGHYDLCEKTTTDWMKSQYPRVNLIALDAEIPIETITSPKRTAMLLHVINFFLECAAANGILILKMYWQEMDHILRVVTWLRPICHTLVLQHCQASAMNGEVYLVCQLHIRDSSSRKDELPILQPPLGLTRLILRRRDDYLRDIGRDIGGCNLLRVHCYYPAFFVQLAEHLPLHGLSKLAEICKVVLPRHLHRCVDEPVAQWAGKVVKNMKIQGQPLEDDLMGRSRVRDTETFDTQVHKHKIMLRYIVLSAAIRVCELATVRWPVEVTATPSMHHFVHVLQMIPNTGVELLANNELLGEIKLFGHNVEAFRYYVMGLRYGVSIVATAMLKR